MARRKWCVAALLHLAVTGCDAGQAVDVGRSVQQEAITAQAAPSFEKRSHAPAGAPKSSASPQSDRVLAVLIGGFDSDPTAEQIAGTARRGSGQSGLYQLMGDLQTAGVAARYFNWNGTEAGDAANDQPPGALGIARWLRDYHAQHPNVPLAIVGNSWGGQTALEVAAILAREADPVPIAQLHLDDASSLLRSFTGLPSVPANVGAVTNYFTRHVITTGPLPDDGRVDNIDLGNPANGFLREDWGRYDATGDLQAHIQAEWDPLIHADIQQRILELRDE